jgi:hypothetical protein
MEESGTFFGIAAQLMRRILVDYARRRGNQKRGGRVLLITLDEATAVFNDRAGRSRRSLMTPNRPGEGGFAQKSACRTAILRWTQH